MRNFSYVSFQILSIYIWSAFFENLFSNIILHQIFVHKKYSFRWIYKKNIKKYKNFTFL